MATRERALCEHLAYRNGRAAYKSGKPTTDNPHASGMLDSTNRNRYLWFMGWYDAKLEPIYSISSLYNGSARVDLTRSDETCGGV